MYAVPRRSQPLGVPSSEAVPNRLPTSTPPVPNSFPTAWGERSGPRPAQGEWRRDGRGPDTAPGYRVVRTHRRAPSGATEQERTVHCAAASHHHRSPEAELPFARKGLRAGHRWRDVADLWREPRREAEGPARQGAPGQLPSATGQTNLHSEG